MGKSGLFEEARLALRECYQKALALHAQAWEAELDELAWDALEAGSQISGVLQDFNEEKAEWQKIIAKNNKEMARIEAALLKAEKAIRKKPKKIKIDGKTVVVNPSINEMALVVALLQLSPGETYTDATALFNAAWGDKKGPYSLVYRQTLTCEEYLNDPKGYMRDVKGICQKFDNWVTGKTADELLPRYENRFEELKRKFNNAGVLKKAFPLAPTQES